jgi:hypothetical protein
MKQVNAVFKNDEIVENMQKIWGSNTAAGALRSTVIGFNYLCADMINSEAPEKLLERIDHFTKDELKLLCDLYGKEEVTEDKVLTREMIIADLRCRFSMSTLAKRYGVDQKHLLENLKYINPFDLFCVIYILPKHRELID